MIFDKIFIIVIISVIYVNLIAVALVINTTIVNITFRQDVINIRDLENINLSYPDIIALNTDPSVVRVILVAIIINIFFANIICSIDSELINI